MTNHVRWYVNVARWKPTREQWLRLTASIASEELERINKFVFQDDSKSSLIGCALIRKFLTEASSVPSNDIVLTRTSYGRPIICEAYKRSTWLPMTDFNVSHSGDYCVLAGVWSKKESPMIKVGVDVTKIVRKNSKQELDRFLDLMSRREFTRSEWESVERATSDRQKCINFTRLWCLKESYIKAIGTGLSFKLRRIDFRFSEKHKLDLSTDTLKRVMLDDTTVYLDGKLETDWRFYETALDDEHIVALGYYVQDLDEQTKVSSFNEHFQEVAVDSIVDSLKPMRDTNENDWIHFSTRSIKSII